MIEVKKYICLFMCCIFTACAFNKTETFKERQYSYSQQAEKYKGLYANCSSAKCDSLLWWAANSQFKSEEFSCSLSVDKKVSNECRHVESRPLFWDLKKEHPESKYAPPTFVRIAYIEDLNGQYGIANEVLQEFVLKWPTHELAKYARDQLDIYRKRKIGQ